MYETSKVVSKMEERIDFLEKLVCDFVHDTRAIRYGITNSTKPYSESNIKYRLEGLEYLVNKLPKDDKCYKGRE